MELCERVRQTGVEHVQLALDPFGSGDSGWDVQEAIHGFEEQGVGIRSGMLTTIGENYSSLERIKETGGYRVDAFWSENLERAKRGGGVAKEFGIDLVTVHAGFIPEKGDPLHQKMTDRIGEIARVLEEMGVRLGLETGQETAEGLNAFLGQGGLEGIGVNFDPANMILYGMGDPIEAMELLRDRIVQVHMKDAIATMVQGTWGEEVVAGTGDVDWEAFFGIVEGLEKRVDVMIEREAGEQRVEDVVSARELAQRFVDVKGSNDG